MTLRRAATIMLILAACRKDAGPADRESTADDPWASHPTTATTPRAPRPPPPPRKLSLDGEIQGATPELLATQLPGYADPKVGDWRAFRHVTTGTLGDFHATAIAVVTAVTPTSVTIELSGRLEETGEQRSDGADELPRSFTVAHEIHRQHGDWTASHVKLGDEAQTASGRRFECKKVSAAFVDPMLPGKDVQVDVWLAPEVPAGGEVAVHEVQKTAAMTITMTSELVGYGDAGHTTWGTRPTGL